MALTSCSYPLFKDPMLPGFEGDDLRRLAQEIAKARSFLCQAKAFRYGHQQPSHVQYGSSPPRPWALPRHGPPWSWHPCSESSCPASPLQALKTGHSGGPYSFISCLLGPNSRKRKTVQNQKLLFFRDLFSR